jgi:hypothetical protein
MQLLLNYRETLRALFLQPSRLATLQLPAIAVLGNEMLEGIQNVKKVPA